ncbi:hypothetical protein JCM16303_003149 [Sporobolomyces ruberrimus]
MTTIFRLARNLSSSHLATHPKSHQRLLHVHPLPYTSAPPRTNTNQSTCDARRLRSGKPIRFNKYIQVAARATRQALKEEQRVAAEKRGVVTLKYQKWADGKPNTAEWIVPPTEAQH